MAHLTFITATAAIFVVAALLYAQTKKKEGFTDAVVPADLNRAPLTTSSNAVPPSVPSQPGAPTGATAPREALAQRKDLSELDTQITMWLEGATQRETTVPGSLTPEQLQERVMLQGRLVSVRTQLGTDKITDTARRVRSEALELRLSNAGWRALAPTLEDALAFGQGHAPESLLTPELFTQFKGIFAAGLKELTDQPQPDPLQRVRIQQLQIYQQDLRSVPLPPIRVASARLFLKQMLRPDQPLPTLFAIGATCDKGPEGSVGPHTVVSRHREPVAEPVAFSSSEGLTPLSLCRQIRRAFSPADAEALGCGQHVDANTVATVCSRLRDTVPSVTPEQFNCPRPQ